MTAPLRCGVCGGTRFSGRKVLWDALIRDWQLSEAEVDYIDRQQGETCDACGCNLRSIALANALRASLATEALFQDLPTSPSVRECEILEINEAGHLTPFLRQFPRYTFAAYPEVDMHALPYDEGRFDLVVHSDTLEHVRHPVHALTECRRVLKPGGSLCFTIPIIVGRMTRGRDGLPRSYHGSGSTRADDLVVQTEFGADAWTHVMEAGFSEVAIHALSYPAATALAARKR